MVDIRNPSQGFENQETFSVIFGKTKFQSGKIYTIHGKPKSGKTSVCLYLANELHKKNKQGLYIDTEGKLDGYSLIEIYESLFKKLLYYTNIDKKEFQDILNNLGIIIKENNINFIIIDSLSYPFVKLKTKAVWKKSTEVYQKLKELTHKYKLITVVVTYSIKKWKEGMEIARGGDIISHFSDEIIRIAKDSQKRKKGVETKFSCLIKPDGAKILFVIQGGVIKSIG